MPSLNSRAPQKVMVLGARGMLGHMVTTVLEESGHNVIGVSRLGNFGREPVAINLEEWVLLEEQIFSHRPDWIINCAGFLNEEVDKNKASAILINSFLPQKLADEGTRFGYRTITIGSDCVFEGDRGNYTVKDIPDALSWYGRTKQLGELRNARDLTIRTSIIGPELESSGRGLLLWLVSQGTEVNGWTSANWTGVTTLELAKVIDKIITTEIQATGIWQLVPSAAITKYELLRLMNSTYLDSKLTVNQVTGVEHDRSLINDRPETWSLPSYTDMLLELKEWIKERQELYRSTVFEFQDACD